MRRMVHRSSQQLLALSQTVRRRRDPARAARLRHRRVRLGGRGDDPPGPRHDQVARRRARLRRRRLPPAAHAADGAAHAPRGDLLHRGRRRREGGGDDRDRPGRAPDPGRRRPPRPQPRRRRTDARRLARLGHRRPPARVAAGLRAGPALRPGAGRARPLRPVDARRPLAGAVHPARELPRPRSRDGRRPRPPGGPVGHRRGERRGRRRPRGDGPAHLRAVREQRDRREHGPRASRSPATSPRRTAAGSTSSGPSRRASPCSCPRPRPTDGREADAGGYGGDRVRE